jgi:hypothetical protein
MCASTSCSTTRTFLTMRASRNIGAARRRHRAVATANPAIHSGMAR